jgi:hypothetical protein
MRSGEQSPRTAKEALLRHTPEDHAATYPRRSDDELPFDPSAIPAGLPVMLDTNFYILRAQNKVPPRILDFVFSRRALHCAIALAEISISLGILDPKHPKTPENRTALEEILASITLAACRSPGPAAWAEAGLIAGMLSRTQFGIAKPKAGLSAAEACCQAGQRRRLLSDVLLFLSAYETHAVLLSANVRDMDLLLPFRPDAQILLFRPAKP